MFLLNVQKIDGVQKGKGMHSPKSLPNRFGDDQPFSAPGSYHGLNSMGPTYLNNSPQLGTRVN